MGVRRVYPQGDERRGCHESVHWFFGAGEPLREFQHMVVKNKGNRIPRKICLIRVWELH